MVDYFKVGFLFFAVASLTQRILEIRRHQRREGRIVASWTLWVMGMIHFLFYAGGVVEVLFLVDEPNFYLVSLGFFLFLLGFLLRKWVIRTLGEFWSVHIEIREDHPLITEGPYAFSRHPNYLAILLELAGYCLIANAYLTLAVSLVAYSLVLFFRIRLEESQMIKKFRRNYVRYRRKTPALVPSLRWDRTPVARSPSPESPLLQTK